MSIKKVVVADEFNFQGNIKDQITSAALAALTPAKGDRYIVTDGANQNKIARCTVGGATPTWEYIAVSEGFICWDESEDKFYKYISSWTELSPAETATTIAAIINGSSADTPLDADEWGFRDAVDSILKKITWANIKATLKTYFDGLYVTQSEANFTPTDQSGAGLSFSAATGHYIKIGKMVLAKYQVTYPTTANGNVARVLLPFTSDNAGNTGYFTNKVVSTSAITAFINPGVNYVTFYSDSSIDQRTNANLSGLALYFSVCYQASS